MACRHTCVNVLNRHWRLQTAAELQARLPSPRLVKISSTSTLIVEVANVQLKVCPPPPPPHCGYDVLDRFSA